MKIRDKLFLGFGIYILLSALLGLFAYRDLRTIGRGLSRVEIADDITNTLLEARRYEKNHLLYRDAGSLEEFQKYLEVLKAAIEKSAAGIIDEIGQDKYARMQRALKEYERHMTAIVANQASQHEVAEIVRKRGRAVETTLSGGSHETFLNLRRFEKNVMLDRSREAYDRFRQALEESGLSDRENVRLYGDLVGKLHFLYQEERFTVDGMRRAARAIQAVAENLAREERQDIDRTLHMSFLLLGAGLAVITLLGLVVNFKLARSIVTPLGELQRITKKISRGDFSESIEVKGQDEIASLAASFNQMEDKLDLAMTSLDETIKKLQEKQSQLVEAEKLASIGKLAAGIAHEINNPLTSVLTFSNLMLEQCPPDDPRHGRLKLMVKETDRARTIVRQLLNFGKESVLKPEKIDINRPVTEIAESLVAQEAFKGIDLSLACAPDLPEVYADPAQLGQVVLNILLNAIHAITPPGRIEVRTRRAEHHVEILFTDTGKGIPQDHLHKIFDPFFTTKSASKGTGLGLAVSYGIIKKHGGDIAVESAEGKGTTFIVRLPIYG